MSSGSRANPAVPRAIRDPGWAGRDLPQDTGVVCRRRVSAAGPGRPPIRTFGTRTEPLLAGVDGRVAAGVTPAALESTGGDGKPLCNRRAGRVAVILVPAPPLTPGPGRKTAVTDGEGRAPWLPPGRLQARFGPPRPTRAGRDRTRPRTPLVRPTASLAHRIPKLRAEATLKRGAVARAVLGAAGRARRRAWIAGETDPEQRAEGARHRRRAPIPAVRRAWPGRVRDPHRFRLQWQGDQGPSWEDLSGRLPGRIAAARASWAEAGDLRPTLPGGSQGVAEPVRAEIGPPREQIPTGAPLASGAGLGPGTDERAGPRRRGRTTPGSRGRRGMWVPAAGAARPTQESSLAAPDRRRARRQGRNRAWIAVGPPLLVISYPVLKNGRPAHERGGDALDRREPERLTRQWVRRLEQLGHQVTLNAQPT